MDICFFTSGVLLFILLLAYCVRYFSNKATAGIFKSFCKDRVYAIIRVEGEPVLFSDHKGLPFELSHRSAYSPSTSSSSEYRGWMTFRITIYLPVEYIFKLYNVGDEYPGKIIPMDFGNLNLGNLSLPERVLTCNEDFDKLFQFDTPDVEKLKPVINDIISTEVKTLLHEFYRKYDYIPVIQLKNHYLEIHNHHGAMDISRWNEILDIGEALVGNFMKYNLPSSLDDSNNKFLPQGD